MDSRRRRRRRRRPRWPGPASRCTNGRRLRRSPRLGVRFLRRPGRSPAGARSSTRKASSMFAASHSFTEIGWPSHRPGRACQWRAAARSPGHSKRLRTQPPQLAQSADTAQASTTSIIHDSGPTPPLPPSHRSKKCCHPKGYDAAMTSRDPPVALPTSKPSMCYRRPHIPPNPTGPQPTGNAESDRLVVLIVGLIPKSHEIARPQVSTTNPACPSGRSPRRPRSGKCPTRATSWWYPTRVSSTQVRVPPGSSVRRIEAHLRFAEAQARHDDGRLSRSPCCVRIGTRLVGVGDVEVGQAS